MLSLRYDLRSTGQVSQQVMEIRQAPNHIVVENIISKHWQAATGQRDLSKSIDMN